jgi:hypothetical protein
MAWNLPNITTHNSRIGFAVRRWRRMLLDEAGPQATRIRGGGGRQNENQGTIRELMLDAEDCRLVYTFAGRNIGSRRRNNEVF